MIVVGVEESERSADALALARRLAQVTGAELVLVNAYPFEAHEEGPQRPEYEAFVRSRSEEVLQQHVAELGAGAVALRTRSVPQFSPARALHEVAVEVSAAAVVVGATRRGAPGRVATGTVADRLLAGAPCPVAVAPAGYAAAGGDGFGRLGVAYVASEAGAGALQAAGRLAASAGATVDVIAVVDPHRWERDAWAGRADEAELAAAHRELAERRVAAALEDLPADVRGEARILEGDPVAELLRACAGLDLLICGSRDYGPATTVLLGGVSKALMREAPAPVMVVPRR